MIKGDAQTDRRTAKEVVMVEFNLVSEEQLKLSSQRNCHSSKLGESV